MSSIDALRAFVGRFRDEQDRLDVLVNNAGVMPDERQESVDGVELTFTTHVVAPWVLIDGLVSLLRRGEPGRVIDVTSGGQYGQSVAQLVITRQWAEQLRGSGVVVHAMHPGWSDTKGVRNWMPAFRVLTLPVIRTPEQGADTIVWFGAAPEPARSTGGLWHDRRARPATYRLGAKPDDATTARAVWDRVAAIAGGPGDRSGSDG